MPATGRVQPAGRVGLPWPLAAAGGEAEGRQDCSFVPSLVKGRPSADRGAAALAG